MRRTSRRTALLAVGSLAGAAAIGAGATELAQPSATAQPIPPPEDLMREHGVLKRILLCYREAGRLVLAGQPLPTRPVHDGAVIIRDYIESFHEGLEEAYVFPRLRQANVLVSTVDTLLIQHARGRRITASIIAGTTQPVRASAARQLIASMDSFVRMYEPHEAREDTVIFPRFRQITPAKTLTSLGERFAEEERKLFGRTGFTDMVNKVAAIEESLDIADLAAFTPEA
ncbi:MAG TPA: hemerythrin domain-containing protein [Mycobacteriales bacterium]|nr:hemerythrin domain-containing protein [Mycobacteriales bacterium]